MFLTYIEKEESVSVVVPSVVVSSVVVSSVVVSSVVVSSVAGWLMSWLYMLPRPVPSMECVPVPSPCPPDEEPPEDEPPEDEPPEEEPPEDEPPEDEPPDEEELPCPFPPPCPLILPLARACPAARTIIATVKTAIIFLIVCLLVYIGCLYFHNG